MEIIPHSMPAARTFLISNNGSSVYYFLSAFHYFLEKLLQKEPIYFVTDGATSEYISTLKCIGEDGVYTDGYHGLCYFHLVIQSWNKYVKPYITPNIKKKSTNQWQLSTIRKWFKSWFFNVERKIEYHYSKRFFQR